MKLRVDSVEEFTMFIAQLDATACDTVSHYYDGSTFMPIVGYPMMITTSLTFDNCGRLTSYNHSCFTRKDAEELLR